MNLEVTDRNPSSMISPSRNGGKEIYYPESDGKPMGETDYHIKTIMMLHQILELFFKHSSDVRIFTDIMFYYEEGNPRKVVAPDVMVVKGVAQHLRRTFKVWEEKVPDVVFEISSRKTWKEDLQKKYEIYQSLGVNEYYIFDPEYDHLNQEPLIAFHSNGTSFEKMNIEQGRVFSPVLGLEIVDTGEILRLFNPSSERFLLTVQELGEEVERLQMELAKQEEK